MTKVFFQTHGCSVNISESESMMGLLDRAGFKIADDSKDADIIIINICTVKGNITAIKEIRDFNERHPSKKIIVAGCVTKEIIPLVREINENISFINTHNIERTVEFVEEVLNDNVVELLTKDEGKVKLGMPKIRKNNVVGIVPILSGCVFNCSYCSVKWIKGHLCSYPKERIIEEAKQHLKSGCKEIWITSQDNAAYGLEISNKSTLPELLNKIADINGDFFIRVGMMNPKNVLHIIDDLIEAYKSPKIFKFLHIPVQSGNDEILRLMNRPYTIGEFKPIIDEFRKKIPQITIATDAIVGFPTETDEQFSDSVDLIKEIEPDVLNISRFIPRQNTKAAKMKQLPGGVIKDRSRILTEIYHNIARLRNEKWLQWEGKVLIDEIGKDGTLIGRNYAYKPVILKGDFKPGDIVKIKIENVSSFDLKGRVC